MCYLQQIIPGLRNHYRMGGGGGSQVKHSERHVPGKIYGLGIVKARGGVHYSGLSGERGEREAGNWFVM